MIALLGKKLGMTHVYNDAGEMVSVTVIEAGPCPILAVNTKNIQLGFDMAKEKSLNKPQAGMFKKLNIAPRKFIREINKEVGTEYKVGDELKADLFKSGDFVDVTGTSLGKGFQGGMKRWNWKGGKMTHGSMSHRRVGSMGSTTTPGRVWKGHHLPGHMGNVRVTVQNLKVFKADVENNVILVEGAVPGHKNNYVIIQKAKKKTAAALTKKAVEPAKAKGKK
jgi:large subunit ribosomal protein L3